MGIEPLCSSCNKTGLNQILFCQKQNADSCIYKVRKDPVSTKINKPVGLLSFIFGVFFIFLFINGLINSYFDPFFLIGFGIFLFPFLLVIILFTLMVIYLPFGYKFSLYSPKLSSFQIYKLFNIKLAQVFYSEPEEVHIEIEVEKYPEFPASILSVDESTEENIINEKDSIGILISVLSYLLSKNIISIWKTKVSVAFFNFKLKRFSDKETYIVLPGEKLGVTNVNGLLESKILSVISEWYLMKESAAFPPAPPFKYLVKSLFNNKHINPDLWIIEMVQKDAVNSGFFIQDENYFKIKPEFRNELKTQYRIIAGIKEKFRQNYKELFQEMTKEIDKGLNLMSI